MIMVEQQLHQKIMVEKKEALAEDKMKNKILFLIFAMIFIVLSVSVYADVPVNYALREATISDSGSISYSDTPVTDVGVFGYACADAQCDYVVGAPLWNANSGSSDVFQVVYPTDLPSSGYYAVFFYKEGYIPYEVKAFWHGTAGEQSSTAYLSRKDIGRAPIDNFNVANEVQPNVPVVMAIDASLDSQAYAALHNAGPVNYVPSQLVSHYSVETRVTLRVYDEDEDIVYETERVVDIPYSGSTEVEFSWTPEDDGDYRAVVTTFVTDSKFLTSEEHEVMKEFHVIEEDPRGMCYTLLSGLALSNQFPSQGEVLTISGNKLSNYADDNYVLTPVPTGLVLEVMDNTGAVVYTDSLNMNSNDNSVDRESFSFEWTPAAEGWYEVLVTGTADSNLCNGIENLDESERVRFYVSGAPSASAPVLEGIPDYVLEEGQTIGLLLENGLESIPLIDLWSYTTDADTVDEDLRFSIVGQTNEDLLVCSVEYNQYLGCNMPNGFGYSDVTVEVSDGEFSDRDSFRITVRRDNSAPIIGNVPNVELMISESVSFDLDDYVDDDSPDNELSWSVEGDSHVNVEISPYSHTATISTKKDSKWYGQDTLTFTVTDSEGLTASDNCAVIVLDDAPEPEKNKLTISRIIMNDIISSDEILQLNIRLYNSGNQDLKDVRVDAIVLDLEDVYDSAGPFEIEEGDTVTKSMFLVLPEDAEPGYYYVRVSVDNNDIRRVVYREVIIE
jgi:hypothetical protein